MFLRTKIFRQLVLFAFIPSLIIGLTVYYMLFEALDRAGAWISVSSPDRTINSLRLVESRLQELADFRLNRSGTSESAPDSILEWRLTIENGHVSSIVVVGEWPGLDDSLIGRYVLDAEPGPVREVIGNHLVLGSMVSRGDEKTAGGFILDREYLDGFSAVTGDLSRWRQFSNVFPGLRLFLIVAGVAVLIFIIIVAYMLSRRLSRTVSAPLVELTEATAAAAEGDYSQRITPTGTEEVRRLTDTFNRMLADLEDSRRRLVDAERVAAWQEFARRMAHELKNPLTPISLSLYRIKKALQESGLFDRFKESIEAISTQVARLERLAEDYSSLARLPAPKMKSFDFIEAVNNLVALYRPQLDTYRFTATIPAHPVVITADPDHLNQVMVNLIKNAIEFTPGGGNIILSVRREDRRIVFSLVNDSEEIHAKNLGSARMPYFSTREGGSGLGLAVSEKIIVDHGGSLKLDVEDGMAVVRFEIPVRGPQGDGI